MRPFLRSIVFALGLLTATSSVAQAFTIMSTPVISVPPTSRFYCAFTNLSSKPLAVSIFVIDQNDNIQSQSNYAAVLASQSVVFRTDNLLGFNRCVFDFQGSAKFVRAVAQVTDVDDVPQATVPAN